MLQESLMSEKGKFSMEKFRKDCALKVANRNATETQLEPI